MREYFMPLGVMRAWPEAIDIIRESTGESITVAAVLGIPPSVGYVPIYASLQDLINEHGDVPYSVLRRKGLIP